LTVLPTAAIGSLPPVLAGCAGGMGSQQGMGLLATAAAFVRVARGDTTPAACGSSGEILRCFLDGGAPSSSEIGVTAVRRRERT